MQAIQSLGIISSVNLSSVDEDLVTQKTERYFRARYPKNFKGLGKTNCTYTIASYPNSKAFAFSIPHIVPLPLMNKVKA